MSVGLFLDLDGVLTPKAVNLQYAKMLRIESRLLELEDDYANGLINNEQFNKVFIPLFRDSGFTQDFAKRQFQKIILSPYAEELVQVNLPNTFIVSSSPSYFVEPFARKYGIPSEHVLCSRYSFDDQGKINACVSPAGVIQKADFVAERVSRFSVSIGVGDSPNQDAKFMHHCTLRVLMGGERRNYLQANDLTTIHSLVQLFRSFENKMPSYPPACYRGIKQLLVNSKYEKNVFIITPFKSDIRYLEAIKSIKGELKSYGFRGWTANELDLDGDLWVNVQCFMHGCSIGIALITAAEIERESGIEVRADIHNANVITESGYMLGQNKKVLVLKDKRSAMPTDWAGKLYKPIDFSNPVPDIKKAIKTWFRVHEQ